MHALTMHVLQKKFCKNVLQNNLQKSLSCTFIIIPCDMPCLEHNSYHVSGITEHVAGIAKEVHNFTLFNVVSFTKVSGDNLVHNISNSSMCVVVVFIFN